MESMALSGGNQLIIITNVSFQHHFLMQILLCRYKKSQKYYIKSYTYNQKIFSQGLIMQGSQHCKPFILNHSHNNNIIQYRILGSYTKCIPIF